VEIKRPDNRKGLAITLVLLAAFVNAIMIVFVKLTSASVDTQTIIFARFLKKEISGACPGVRDDGVSQGESVISPWVDVHANLFRVVDIISGNNLGRLRPSY